MDIGPEERSRAGRHFGCDREYQRLLNRAREAGGLRKDEDIVRYELKEAISLVETLCAETRVGIIKSAMGDLAEETMNLLMDLDAIMQTYGAHKWWRRDNVGKREV
jgi:hypothetical protein